MKKVQLLSTVTAALLLTAGAVSAQGLDMKKDEAPAHAPAAQRKAPAEKMAPSMKAGEHKPACNASRRTTGQAPKPGEKKLPETTGQAPNSSEHDRAKSASDKKGSSDKRTIVPRARRYEIKGQRECSGIHWCGAAPCHHRPRRGGRRRQAVDRTAQQDHHHLQASQSGAGAPQHLHSRGCARAGDRAFLSAAGRGGRRLSRMARLRLHPGRRPDSRRRPGQSRDRRGARSVTLCG